MKGVLFLALMMLPSSISCSENPLDDFKLYGLTAHMTDNGTLRLYGTVGNNGPQPRGVKIRVTIRSIDGDTRITRDIWIEKNITDTERFDAPIGNIEVEITNSRIW